MTDRQSDDMGPAALAAPTGLSDTEVDAVLVGLAGAVAEVITDINAAERDLDMWTDEEEQFIGAPYVLGGTRHAVASLRWQVAAATTRELRAAGRELVVWWADLATYAVLAAVRGVPVELARGAAAEPGRYFSVEELARLPELSEQDRRLAGLAARMGSSPIGGSAAGDDDMPTVAREIAARAGLLVKHLPGGAAEIVEDASVEGRRCRLWGDLWVDYKMPDLPPADWITEVLASAGVGPAVVEEVRGAAAAVGDLRAAAAGLDELESAEDSAETGRAVMDEFDALWDQLDPATDVLASYADVLTRQLPMIRQDLAAAGADHGDRREP